MLLPVLNGPNGRQQCLTTHVGHEDAAVLCSGAIMAAKLLFLGVDGPGFVFR